MEKRIEARGVTKSFGKRADKVAVLRGIDIDVYRGEFVSIVGKSGSGKSTLLYALGGLIKFDNGSVRICGTNIEGLSGNAIAKVRRDFLGFIFQDLNLLGSLNVMDNVRLPAKLSGASVSNQSINAVLDRVGLLHKRKMYPEELSGGQRQRVAIARAIIRNPPILLADEPTGSLDAASTESVMGLFTDAIGEDVSRVMVTHDLDIASRADRVVVLEDGLAKRTLTGATSADIFNALHGK